MKSWNDIGRAARSAAILLTLPLLLLGCGGGSSSLSSSSSSSSTTSNTVSTSAGTGGTISPASATVNDGSTTGFTVTADTGYKIGSVSGCSGSLSGTTYTTGAVTAACTVTASFTSTTKPTASVNQTGTTLDKSAGLVVTFSKAMDTSSLTLSGTLATASDGGTWSNNDTTLTIKPKTTWPRGPDLALTLNATDQDGNVMNTLTENYLVKLIFSNFQSAAVEIGQADFTGYKSNQGTSTPGANTLTYPDGNPIVSATGVLFLSDEGNNRVLAYNTIPTVNDANADFVLGQSDFTSNTANTTQSGLAGPMQISIANDKMAIADNGNNRVLIYNSVPVGGPAAPDLVLGQAGFTSASNVTCDASHMNTPDAVTILASGKIVVADSYHNRMLIWNSLPTTNGQAPDLVLGQQDFTHCQYNDDNQDGSVDTTSSARTLEYPSGIWTDGTRLVVNDEGNNRVLIWNTFPTSNFQPADLVLGQSDFTHNTADDDNQNGSYAPTARTLNDDYNGVSSNGVQLAVADASNNRVLIWNTFPTSNFQPADVVLGQSDFAHTTANDDNQDGTKDAKPTSRVLNYPDGLLFYQDKLLVMDYSNHRVLAFQSQ